jgi:hypothetical protein
MLVDTGGFVFTNNHSVALTLNDDTYPFTEELDIVLDDPNFEKRPITGYDESHFMRGNLPGMTITCQGTILGDSSTDYWTKRLALTHCLRSVDATPTTYPYRSGALDNYQDGQIRITPVGVGTTWQTFNGAYVMAFSAPMKPGYATTSEYMITFYHNAAFFMGDDGNAYYPS